MDRTGAQSVEAYIASQPEAARAALERVRGAIRKAAPDAESISYKIPTYKIHGVPFLYFAGWKQHYSIYPASDRIIAAFKDDLAMYEVRKSTVRFPLAQPVPEPLIGRIAKFRAKEVAGRMKAAPKKG